MDIPLGLFTLHTYNLSKIRKKFDVLQVII